ncbi:hypothetical protein ACVW04_003253 [Bradyrhizobium sp. LM2.3]
MGKICAAAREADPHRRTGAREYLVLLREVEQLAAEEVDQQSIGVEYGDDVYALVEQFENSFPWSAGVCPDEVAVDAGCHLVVDRDACEHPPADVAIRHRADDSSVRILRKEDAEHVGVEAPEGFLNRLCLGNGDVALVCQGLGPKSGGNSSPYPRVASHSKRPRSGLLDTAGGRMMQVSSERPDRGAVAALLVPI